MHTKYVTAHILITARVQTSFSSLTITRREKNLPALGPCRQQMKQDSSQAICLVREISQPTTPPLCKPGLNGGQHIVIGISKPLTTLQNPITPNMVSSYFKSPNQVPNLSFYSQPLLKYALLKRQESFIRISFNNK